MTPKITAAIEREKALMEKCRCSGDCVEGQWVREYDNNCEVHREENQ